MTKPRDLQYRVVFECPQCGHENECFLKYRRHSAQISECSECDTYFEDKAWPAVEGPDEITQAQREAITPPENYSIEEIMKATAEVEVADGES